jgi:hypothetical protein
MPERFASAANWWMRDSMNESKTDARSNLIVKRINVGAPHSLLFVFFNLLYFLPLFVVLFFSYSEGGTGDAADLDAKALLRITYIFCSGTLAFLLGSRLMWNGNSSDDRRKGLAALQLFVPGRPFGALCVIAVVIFVLSKALLAPLGVYTEYAFDTENMIGGIWSFSMFCSESLLFLSIVVLFSTLRRKVTWFLVLTAINALNLLHGTRIFTMIACIVFCFYQYLRGKLTLRFGAAAFVTALGLGYFVFLSRSGVALDDQTFSISHLASPVMFEGVFSQISLIGTIRHPEAWSVWGSIGSFLHDVTCFVIPRFLLPEKDKLLIIDQFVDLSPLGAFSGYAQGLIYFGWFFPLFYLFLGCLGGWLLRQAARSQFWSMIYMYFVCDFLFRIMRDGYIIPIKMILDSAIILLFVLWCNRHRGPVGIVRNSVAPT